jgi:hypothetical protein
VEEEEEKLGYKATAISYLEGGVPRVLFASQRKKDIPFRFDNKNNLFTTRKL